MADDKQKELFDLISTTITKKLVDAYGQPTAQDNMPARVGVALLQLSLRYFAVTNAPSSVVVEILESLLVGKEPESLSPILQPQSHLSLIKP